LLDCKKTRCQRIADSAPKSADHLCPECGEHFAQVKRYLDILGLPFTLNHRLARGLDYYTRTVFEIQPEAEGGQTTIGGGGRYDDLIEELGGQPTPAIGFATGIERIILNIKQQDVPVPDLPKPQIFIAHAGNEAGDAAIKLAATLRKNGIGVIETIGSKSLRAQLRQANTLAARYTVIIGEQELATDTVTLRDMTTARQEPVPITGLPERLHQLVSTASHNS
jgi:histidyl-tRNA synthetase